MLINTLLFIMRPRCRANSKLPCTLLFEPQCRLFVCFRLRLLRHRTSYGLLFLYLEAGTPTNFVGSLILLLTSRLFER